jgi:hypothetical protein
MKIFKRKRNDGNSEVYDGNISLSWAVNTGSEELWMELVKG